MNPPAPDAYALHISSEIEGRLARCRASIRTAIRHRLQAITAAAGGGKGRRTKVERKQPPLCSYTHEGYSVFYQVDPQTRRVVVLDLGRTAKSA